MEDDNGLKKVKEEFDKNVKNMRLRNRIISGIVALMVLICILIFIMSIN